MDAARLLFREYVAFLDVDLCFQGFEDELKGLPGRYAPPSGVILIASEGEAIAGCVALRALANGECEMKRLFVREAYRKSGLGTRLAYEVIDVARSLGYTLMRLDTLDRLSEAMQLYASLGFRKTEPYYENPLDGVVFWELDLSDTRGR